MEIDTETAILIVAGTIAAISFGVAYWKSPKFRVAVNKYVKKMYREYKDEIYMYCDMYIDDIMIEVDVEISTATHKYIKNEVLRAAVEAKLDLYAAHADEWAKIEYKKILEDLIGNQ